MRILTNLSFSQRHQIHKLMAKNTPTSSWFSAINTRWECSSFKWAFARDQPCISTDFEKSENPDSLYFEIETVSHSMFEWKSFDSMSISLKSIFVFGKFLWVKVSQTFPVRHFTPQFSTWRYWSGCTGDLMAMANVPWHDICPIFSCL